MDEAGEAKEEEQERRRCSALMGRGVGDRGPCACFPQLLQSKRNSSTYIDHRVPKSWHGQTSQELLSGLFPLHVQWLQKVLFDVV